MQNATALVLSCTEKLVLRINVHTHTRTHEIPVLPGDMRRFTETVVASLASQCGDAKRSGPHSV